MASDSSNPPAKFRALSGASGPDELDEKPPQAYDADIAGFYWQQTRENLISPAGLRMFELAYQHKDEPFDKARLEIDKDYEQLSPRLRKKSRASLRHGGNFINNFSLFQELGLMYLDEVNQIKYLRVTPAGEQAAILLKKLPGPLRVIPYFLLELLSRYRFKNPFRG